MEVSCLGVVLMNSDAVTHLAALCSIHSCGSARRGQAVSMSAVRHSKLGSSTSVNGFLQRPVDVCFGSKADIEVLPLNVCFTPKSGHRNSLAECPLCAKSGHRNFYSITSSARVSSVAGMDKPIAFAAFRLTISSNSF